MQKVLSPLLAIVCMLLIASAAGADQTYTCGNVDGSTDGKVNLGDITSLISYVYLDGPPPPIPELANLDGSPDGKLNLTDITKLICLVYLDGCQIACPPCHQEIRGECLMTDGTDSDTSYMILEVLGGALYIHHVNASYQCCLEYVVHYEITDNHITAREDDVGMECDCICPFNLTSVLYNLPEGEYVVELVGIYGNTIGIDTVEISYETGLVDYDFTGCKAAPSIAQAENVNWVYDDGALTVNHIDAFYNCGAEIDGFIVQFHQTGDTLRLFELNMMRMGMYCMCYYDLSATISGLPPGAYFLEIWGQDGFWFQAPVELLDRRQILLE